MATLNLSPFPTFSSPSFLPSYSSQNTPTLSSYLHPNIPSISFRSITLRRPTSTLCRPRARTIVSALKKLSETDLVAIPDGADEIVGKFPQVPGVYGIYDKNKDLQFIGITRNIAASVLTHQKSVPDLCCCVKASIVDDPDRTTLTEAWKSWMEEHISITGKVPPGNESGNATWVQQQKKKKADLRLTPGPHVQLTVPLEELIDQLVKENNVVAFIKGSRSAPQCGFSHRVIGILENEGIDYESVDVLDEQYNHGLRETLKKYSNWPTFPQIFVNGELIGGCDILSSMYEKGELAGLFKK